MSVSDIIIHAAELEERSEYAPAVSVFLTPAEQAKLWQRVRYPHRLFFWGGFTEAERRAAVFIPEWAADGAPYSSGIRYDSTEREAYLKSLIFGDDAPFGELADEILLIQIKGSGHRVLSHRDILGSVMSLGITRQSAGDICMISDHEAVAAIAGKLREYISEELSKVGSDGVKIAPLQNPGGFAFQRQYEELSVTVASMRLDGIVSAVTGLSRTKAAEHITAGLVQLSGAVEDDTSAEVNEGDTVTVRGWGKYRIAGTDGVTRKSRLRVNVRKYM